MNERMTMRERPEGGTTIRSGAGLGYGWDAGFFLTVAFDLPVAGCAGTVHPADGYHVNGTATIDRREK